MPPFAKPPSPSRAGSLPAHGDEHFLQSGLNVVRSNPLLILIALMVVCVPLLPAPTESWRWHGGKTLGFEAGSIVVGGIWLCRLRSPHDLARAFSLSRSGPFPFLLLLVTLAALSFAFPAGSVIGTHALMVQGLIPLACGVVTSFVTASALHRKADFEFLLDALIVSALLQGLLGLAFLGAGSDVLAVGSFHDHQLYGAFLMLVTPIMLTTALTPTNPTRRIAAQAALLVCLVCLVVSRTRASWIGEAVALLTFAGLFLGTRPRAKRAPLGSRGWPNLSSGAVLAAACLAAVLLVSFQQGLPLAQRARTLTSSAWLGRDESFAWRLVSWRGTYAMLQARPLTGWGIGSYPVLRGRFVSVARAPDLVLAQGPTLSDQAHDSYLQLGAELGWPGLACWLGALLAFFVTSFQALRRGEGNVRHYVLMGGLAAVVGQTVDALANPAWQYGEVSLFLWVVIGLTAAARTEEEPEGELVAARGGKRVVRILLLSGVVALGAKVLLVAWGATWALPSARL